MLYSQAISNLQGNINSLQQVQIVKNTINVNIFINLIKENAKIDVSNLD